MVKWIQDIIGKVRPTLRKKKVVDTKMGDRTLSVLVASDRKRRIKKIPRDKPMLQALNQTSSEEEYNYSEFTPMNTVG